MIPTGTPVRFTEQKLAEMPELLLLGACVIDLDVGAGAVRLTCGRKTGLYFKRAEIEEMPG